KSETRSAPSALERGLAECAEYRQIRAWHVPRRSLHLVEHRRKRRLELECLLDLVCAYVGVLAVFQETRAMMLADKLDERRRVGLPVRRKSFEVFKDSIE